MLSDAFESNVPLLVYIMLIYAINLEIPFRQFPSGFIIRRILLTNLPPCQSSFNEISFTSAPPFVVDSLRRVFHKIMNVPTFFQFFFRYERIPPEYCCAMGKKIFCTNGNEVDDGIDSDLYCSVHQEA